MELDEEELDLYLTLDNLTRLARYQISLAKKELKIIETLLKEAIDRDTGGKEWESMK